MARNKKFSFSMSRQSRSKTAADDHGDNYDPTATATTTTTTTTTTTAPLAHWNSHPDEPANKAHRILGTSRFPSSPSTGYLPAITSEPSCPSHEVGMARRSSSNLLARSYTAEGARGSENSSVTQRLHPQTSSSTMRSHYDATTSPLSISQQTSDSAVRDRALRRGRPPVLSDRVFDGRQYSPTSPDAEGKSQRKSKPARLDLSKLFPKPRGADGHNFARPMLSPQKMVSSPAAMSTASDYFPRPRTRESTPRIGETRQLRTSAQHQNQAPPNPSSPRRTVDRDEYDNAKVNIRRPPKGVQHWFDALDEDSDETSDDGRVSIHAPRPSGRSQVPKRKSSLDRMLRYAGVLQPARTGMSNLEVSQPDYTNDSFAHEDIVDVGRSASPSQYSVNTHRSVGSNKIKESTLSKTNLQDSSILSFSSSEDEESTSTEARRFSVRRSLDLVADAGEIIIGQAQAFQVRPHIRRPSAGVVSTRSTASTSAATIQVMYTPDIPSIPYHHQSQYQRNSFHSSNRRSSHTRQPSVIHEDEDARPRTAINRPSSPSTQSVRSTRTSASEPQSRLHGSRKLMAVTAEEEALLELMRKKRAELQRQGSLSSSPTVKKRAAEKSHRLRTSRESFREPSLHSPLLSPSRGRPVLAGNNATIGHLRDRSASATSDTWSDSHESSVTRGRFPHYLPTPAEFSPLEPFPPVSPTPTASITSPTDPDLASHPPSPITPGLRIGELDVSVKVASSDTSVDIDETSILEHGIIDNPPSDSLKFDSYKNSGPGHQHCRTASSGAGITFPAPPTNKMRSLTPLSETCSRLSSVAIGDLFPPAAKMRDRRADDRSVHSPGRRDISRQSSVHSTASRMSSYSHGSGSQSAVVEKRSSRVSTKDKDRNRHMNRDVGKSTGRQSRNSASDDVLAAWNSLGGTF